ncbi:MAG: hypothetical protein ACOCS6_04000, partial [Desulfosalsimonas sp.]
MNEYQIEQLQALQMVRQHINAGQGRQTEAILPRQIKQELRRYYDFRDRSAAFHQACFEQTCTAKCYLSNLSACCSKDGIIVFFADVV